MECSEKDGTKKIQECYADVTEP